MNNDEAVSINDISLDNIQKDNCNIKINDQNIESSWKDEKINKLEEELKNRANVSLIYFIVIMGGQCKHCLVLITDVSVASNDSGSKI